MSTYQIPMESASTRDPGVGLGSAIGALAGLLGPVLLGLLVWVAFAVSSDSDAAVLVAVLVVIAVVTLPVALFFLGFSLVASDQFPGWGLGAFVASGTWLLSAVAVVILFLIGGLTAIFEGM
jgi:hypothetical protein